MLHPCRTLCLLQVGHAGTLDPAATGLLIICTGAGTKSIEGFMAAHKEYTGTLKLGEGTPSLDAETEVEERLPWENITGTVVEGQLVCLGVGLVAMAWVTMHGA
jgi:tRNA U55 pseudouridine synthase TruB